MKFQKLFGPIMRVCTLYCTLWRTEQSLPILNGPMQGLERYTRPMHTLCFIYRFFYSNQITLEKDHKENKRPLSFLYGTFLVFNSIERYY